MRPNRILRILPLALIVASLNAEAAIISLSSPGPVSVGSPIEIDLTIDFEPGETLYAYQVNLTFPLFLQAGSVTELGYFAANSVGLVPTIDNTLGQLSVFSSLSGSDALAFADSLFRVTFDTTGVGSGQVGFDLSGLILLDTNFADLPVSAANPASVQVADVSETPEPSTVLTVSAGFAAVVLAGLRRRRQLLLQPASRK